MYRGIGEAFHNGELVGPVNYWIKIEEPVSVKMGRATGEAKEMGETNLRKLVGQRVVIKLQDGQLWDCIVHSSSTRPSGETYLDLDGSSNLRSATEGV